MTNQSQPSNPQTSLDELKRRLSQAQEVVVDSSGKLQTPTEAKTADQSQQGKTVVKPQRWFVTARG